MRQKREFTEEQRERLEEEGAAMPGGSYPIETVEDLRNAIRAIGRAKDREATIKHIVRRARALDSLDLVPEEWMDEEKSAMGDRDWVKVPEWMARNARQGIEWQKERHGGRSGIVDKTMDEAEEMARGRVTVDKAKRMYAWFARHMVDLDAPGARKDSEDYPSPGVVAHALWGGMDKDDSRRAMEWAKRIRDKANAESEEKSLVEWKTTGVVEHKTVPVSGVKVLDEESGLVETIVSVTGVVDRVKDVIEPGAYQKTLAERTPKGVWGHDWNTPISRTEEVVELMPGDPRLPSADRKGDSWPKDAGALLVRTRFNLETQRGREAFSDVKFFGDQQEWSIGYNVPVGGAKVESKTGIRRIQSLDLFEYSPVLFGAMPEAVTQSVKTAQNALKAVRAVEQDAMDEVAQWFEEAREEIEAEIAEFESAMRMSDPDEDDDVDGFDEVSADEGELVPAVAEEKRAGRGNAETLRRYWAEGEGAAKIRWGQEGDFDRCVRAVNQYMPGRAEGYCNLLHHRALGIWPAQHAGIAKSIKPGDWSVGDFAVWNSSGGRARGRVAKIQTTGSIDVPDSSFTVNADEDDPAVLLELWREGDEGWAPTGRMVGHKASTLQRIEPLAKSKAAQQMIERRMEGFMMDDEDDDEPKVYKPGAASILRQIADKLQGGDVDDSLLRSAMSAIERLMDAQPMEEDTEQKPGYRRDMEKKPGWQRDMEEKPVMSDDDDEIEKKPMLDDEEDEEKGEACAKPPCSKYDPESMECKACGYSEKVDITPEAMRAEMLALEVDDEVKAGRREPQRHGGWIWQGDWRGRGGGAQVSVSGGMSKPKPSSSGSSKPKPSSSGSSKPSSSGSAKPSGSGGDFESTTPRNIQEGDSVRDSKGKVKKVKNVIRNHDESRGYREGSRGNTVVEYDDGSTETFQHSEINDQRVDLMKKPKRGQEAPKPEASKPKPDADKPGAPSDSDLMSAIDDYVRAGSGREADRKNRESLGVNDLWQEIRDRSEGTTWGGQDGAINKGVQGLIRDLETSIRENEDDDDFVDTYQPILDKLRGGSKPKPDADKPKPEASKPKPDADSDGFQSASPRGIAEGDSVRTADGKVKKVRKVTNNYDEQRGYREGSRGNSVVEYDDGSTETFQHAEVGEQRIDIMKKPKRGSDTAKPKPDDLTPEERSMVSQFGDTPSTRDRIAKERAAREKYSSVQDMTMDDDVTDEGKYEVRFGRPGNEEDTGMWESEAREYAAELGPEWGIAESGQPAPASGYVVVRKKPDAPDKDKTPSQKPKARLGMNAEESARADEEAAKLRSKPIDGWKLEDDPETGVLTLQAEDESLGEHGGLHFDGEEWRISSWGNGPGFRTAEEAAKYVESEPKPSGGESLSREEISLLNILRGPNGEREEQAMRRIRAERAARMRFAKVPKIEDDISGDKYEVRTGRFDDDQDNTGMWESEARQLAEDLGPEWGIAESGQQSPASGWVVARKKPESGGDKKPNSGGDFSSVSPREIQEGDSVRTPDGKVKKVKKVTRNYDEQRGYREGSRGNTLVEYEDGSSETFQHAGLSDERIDLMKKPKAGSNSKPTEPFNRFQNMNDAAVEQEIQDAEDENDTRAAREARRELERRRGSSTPPKALSRENQDFAEPMAQILDVDNSQGEWASGMRDYDFDTIEGLLDDGISLDNIDDSMDDNRMKDKVRGLLTVADQMDMDPADVLQFRRGSMELGGAVEDQMRAVFDGEPLEDQNPNALRMIADFLGNQSFEGAGDVRSQILDYLDWLEGQKSLAREIVDYMRLVAQ